jgi:Bacterial PH domain
VFAGMQEITIRPRISRWIGGGYALLTSVLAIIYASILLLREISVSGYAFIILTVAMGLAIIMLGATTYGFFRTVYTIKNGRLHARSPFATVDLDINDIIKVERTRIPIYFKGFGASLYSGIFFIPGFGWTKVIITNLNDGMLITTKEEKRYLITPSDPGGFLRTVGQKENGSSIS